MYPASSLFVVVNLFDLDITLSGWLVRFDSIRYLIGYLFNCLLKTFNNTTRKLPFANHLTAKLIN